MKLVLMVVLVLGGIAAGDIDFDINIKQHMDKLTEERYPTENNEGPRERVREYIKGRFEYYGLDVEEQTFTTTINTDPKGIGSEQITVEGTNIIGIVPAVKQQAGAVVVVGADYDTNGLSDPLFRNGAGVAALLETARLYSFNKAWSGRFVANYTTIFVAFDINTKQHQTSPGKPGGHFFVNKWLWPYLNHTTAYFGGAVIFDSIMNVEYEVDSQTITPDFSAIFPDTYKRVKESGSKGDFLAMASFGDNSNSVILKDQFSGSFYRERRATRFRLEDMVLGNGINLDLIVTQFLKSECVHFWTFKDNTNATVPLPALLLTDTKDLRTIQPCVTCRPADKMTDDRIEFVNATVKATTHFLFSRQATLLAEPSVAMARLPSVLMTVFMMALVRLYM